MFKIPREKKNQDYKRYLDALLDYLFGYLERAKPLLDIDNEINLAVNDFERKWVDGSFPGWPVIFIFHLISLNLIDKLKFVFFRKKQLVL